MHKTALDKPAAAIAECARQPSITDYTASRNAQANARQRSMNRPPASPTAQESSHVQTAQHRGTPKATLDKRELSLTDGTASRKAQGNAR